MDQELKQRLIGAAVITALAAIFVPMLFDDPIDESGKSINELKIPELPGKAQDVEIMPLPEKAEDVATIPAPEKPPAPSATSSYEDEDEADLDMATRRGATISEKDVASASPRSNLTQLEPKTAEEEDVDLPGAPAESAPVKVLKTPAPRVLSEDAPEKSTKSVHEQTSKPAVAAESATTRWYLNVGSFSKKSNATAMLDNLKKQGFAVSVKEAASDKGTIYKVRVGPMLDRAKAQEMKSKLAKINVNSFFAEDD
ncbi:SPOR domain-containing protein [Methylomonas sp. MgM2]